MRSLTPAYDEIKQLRSTGNCAGALTILRTRPPRSDEDAFEAVVCLLVCGDVESAVHVCQTHPWKKPWAVQIASAFAASFRSENLDRAVDLARKAANAPGAPCDAAAIYLLLLQKNGRLAEADAYIGSRLQKELAGESFLLTMMAEVALAAGKWGEAYRAACGVLAADPHDYRALLLLSIVNYEIGNIHESLGNALRASVARSGSPPAVLQLMRCRNELGQHYAAIAAFDTLEAQAAVEPDIQVELGRAYRGLGDTGPAVAAYRAALASGARPVEAIRALVAIHACAGDAGALTAVVENYRDEVERDVDSMCSLGLEALDRGEVEKAAHLFRKTLALGVADGEPLRDLPWPVPARRIRHDCEQLELLERRGKLGTAGREALTLLRRYCAQEQGPESAFSPAGTEADALRNALCTSFCMPDVPFSGPALGANDYAAIEDEYRARRLVVIDNFLSPDALVALRRYSEEATVWKMNYTRGYLGALMAQGFSPRVLLAIARQLKTAMPGVLGDHPLMQGWAFKYDQRMQGIDLHADFAEVNVNFWITPDDACEDPTTGGMLVYDVPVPKNWTFFEYNNESEKLAAYVKVHNARAQRVPYRANRCVLFDSSLIHMTDEIHFKPGYENRRVNVTLLYGTPRNVG